MTEDISSNKGQSVFVNTCESANDKKSFHITSVTLQRNSTDGNADESADESRTEELSDNIDMSADVRAETPRHAEYVVRKDDVLYKVTSVGSAPIIPTSTQYGIAVVSNPNADQVDSKFVTNDKNNDFVIRTDCMNGFESSALTANLSGKEFNSKNERFKVVKIESNEPFKRGRWVCMDFLDQSMDQAKKNTISEPDTEARKTDKPVNGVLNADNMTANNDKCLKGVNESEKSVAQDSQNHVNGDISNSVSPNQTFNAPFMPPSNANQSQAQSLTHIIIPQPAQTQVASGSYGHSQSLPQTDLQHVHQPAVPQPGHVSSLQQSFHPHSNIQHPQGLIAPGTCPVSNIPHHQPDVYAQNAPPPSINMQQQPAVMQQQYQTLPQQPRIPAPASQSQPGSAQSQQSPNPHCMQQIPISQGNQQSVNPQTGNEITQQLSSNIAQQYQQPQPSGQATLQHSIPQIPIQLQTFQQPAAPQQIMHQSVPQQVPVQHQHNQPPVQSMPVPQPSNVHQNTSQQPNIPQQAVISNVASHISAQPTVAPPSVQSFLPQQQSTLQQTVIQQPASQSSAQQVLSQPAQLMQSQLPQNSDQQIHMQTMHQQPQIIQQQSIPSQISQSQQQLQQPAPQSMPTHQQQMQHIPQQSNAPPQQQQQQQQQQPQQLSQTVPQQHSQPPQQSAQQLPQQMQPQQIPPQQMQPQQIQPQQMQTQPQQMQPPAQQIQMQPQQQIQQQNGQQQMQHHQQVLQQPVAQQQQQPPPQQPQQSHQLMQGGQSNLPHQPVQQQPQSFQNTVQQQMPQPSQPPHSQSNQPAMLPNVQQGIMTQCMPQSQQQMPANQPPLPQQQHQIQPKSGSMQQSSQPMQSSQSMQQHTLSQTVPNAQAIQQQAQSVQPQQYQPVVTHQSAPNQLNDIPVPTSQAGYQGEMMVPSMSQADVLLASNSVQNQQYVMTQPQSMPMQVQQQLPLHASIQQSYQNATPQPSFMQTSGLTSVASQQQHQTPPISQQSYYCHAAAVSQAIPQMTSSTVSSQDLQHLYSHPQQIMSSVTQPTLITAVASQGIPHQPGVNLSLQQGQPVSYPMHQQYAQSGAGVGAAGGIVSSSQASTNVQTQTAGISSSVGMPLQQQAPPQLQQQQPQYAAPAVMSSLSTSQAPVSTTGFTSTIVHPVQMQQQQQLYNAPISQVSIGQSMAGMQPFAEVAGIDPQQFAYPSPQFQEQVGDAVRGMEEQPRPPEDVDSTAGNNNAVAIDNKIEQAMDLVKSHLMFAVREEVEVLKEKIAELMDRINQLEVENSILKANASPETIELLPKHTSSVAAAAAAAAAATVAPAATAPSIAPNAPASSQPGLAAPANGQPP